MSLCPCSSPDGRCHVGVPVHEALHSRGNVPAPPGLLPASPQQLLRLLRPVPPPRRLGRTWSQSLLHLLWGLPPDELLPLPCSSQVSRVRTNVILTLLRQRMSGCVSTIAVILIWLDFGINCPVIWYYPAWTSPVFKCPDCDLILSILPTANFWFLYTFGYVGRNSSVEG